MSDQPTNLDLQRQISALRDEIKHLKSEEIASLKKNAQQEQAFRAQIDGGRKVILALLFAIGSLAGLAALFWPKH